MSNTRELDDVFDELPPNVQQELQALEEIVYQQKQRIAELEAENARLSAQVLRTQDKALELEQQLAELREAVSEYVDTLSPNAFNKMARLLENSDE